MTGNHNSPAPPPEVCPGLDGEPGEKGEPGHDRGNPCRREFFFSLSNGKWALIDELDFVGRRG